MRVDLPFGRTMLPIEVPDTATVLRPVPVASLLGPVEAVRDALRRPIAGPELRDRVNPGDDVAIVISDLTRPVPNKTILPPILAELRAAGVTNATSPSSTAPGCTGSTRRLSWRRCWARRSPRRYRIVQHVARDRSTLVEVGQQLRHTGGALPRLRRGGCAHRHRLRGAAPVRGLLRRREGRDARCRRRRHRHEQPRRRQPGPPLRELGQDRRQPGLAQIRAIVALCPPHFLLNVTIDTERRITGVFGGDMEPAHEAAVRQAEQPVRHADHPAVRRGGRDQHGPPGRHHASTSR